MLEKVKLALRIKSEHFDNELLDLINAALADLQLTDISKVDETDPLIIMAVKTYCKAHFGTPEKDEYKRLKAAYDEQKAQLLVSSKYRDWE